MTKKLMVFCLALAVAAMSLPARAGDLAGYTSIVTGDSPLAYWQFEDATSADGDTCADTTGGSNGVYRHLNPGTSGLDNIRLVQGLFGGKAAKFFGTGASGSGNFVQIADSNYTPYRLLENTCSVEFWSISCETAEETYSRFISHSEGGTNNYWVGMTTTGENAGQPFVGYPGGTWYAWPPMLADNNWHHVVVTYNYTDPNTTTELWIDGVSRGSRSDPGHMLPPADDWADLIIGAENNQYYVFNGLIGCMDEVAYYGYVLSEAQILEHYNYPEPATIVLLALGGVALLRKRA
jgi:hypothetical protein